MLFKQSELQGEPNFKGWRIELAVSPKAVANLLEKVSRMPFCGLDTESDAPQLTEAKWSKTGIQKHKNFINLWRSQTVGFSLAFPDFSAYYVPLNHRRDNASYGHALKVLQVALSKPCWAHNAKHELMALDRLGLPGEHPQLRCSQVASFLACMDFDGSRGLKAMVQGYYGHQMATFEETVKEGLFGSMAPKDGLVYAAEDAIGALLLGLKAEETIASWGLESWYLDVEMPFLRVLREMTDEGLHFDVEGAEVLGKKLAQDCARYAQQFEHLVGISPSSPVQLQKLYEDGWWPKAKKTKTGWSTDAEVVEGFVVGLEKGSKGHKAAELLLAYRESAKGSSTYTTSLAFNAMQYPDMRLHPEYHQDGTDTGRLSSSNPNGQNFPAHGDLAKQIMELFAAPDGQKLGSSDYSQIDLRVLAHFAGGRLREAYLEGADIHQLTADIVGCSRQQAKTVNFAKVYGAHHKKMATQIGSTIPEAKLFMEKYDRAYREVTGLIKRVVDAAYRRGYVKTLGGRRRLFLEMPSRDPRVVAGGFQSVRKELIDQEELMDAWGDERKAFNTVCQGGAADIIKVAMVKIHQQKPSWFKWHAQIHDDVRWRIEDTTPLREKESMAIVKECMESAYKLTVPLVVEPVLGQSWKDLK